MDHHWQKVWKVGQMGGELGAEAIKLGEKLGKEIYIADETEGIIPRGVQYLWQAMS